jgi:hypothetical protein
VSLLQGFVDKGNATVENQNVSLDKQKRKRGKDARYGHDEITDEK